MKKHSVGHVDESIGNGNESGYSYAPFRRSASDERKWTETNELTTRYADRSPSLLEKSTTVVQLFFPDHYVRFSTPFPDGDLAVRRFTIMGAIGVVFGVTVVYVTRLLGCGHFSAVLTRIYTEYTYVQRISVYWYRHAPHETVAAEFKSAQGTVV